MTATQIFFNRAGRLRSFWRLLIFALLFLTASSFMTISVAFFINRIAGSPAFLESVWGWVVQAVLLLAAATLSGWLCGAVLEGLPLRALGWTPHKGWVRDLLMGSLVGAASLILAAGIAAIAGGFSFKMSAAALWPIVVRTLIVSLLVFMIAGAAEEALFRGYPLQTLLRSWPAWFALIPSSLLFAYVHLGNPNTVRGFTFINTSLAGVWLAVAYIRTRSLWFPLGVHFSWNWMMGAVLGLPVSGISEITPSPLIRATDLGPAWLTGGSYGIEGGAACTFALLVSIIFLWRTTWLSATEELLQLTDRENAVASPSVPATDVTDPSPRLTDPAA